MHCSSPLSASFDNSGRITFSSKNASKELVSFQVPCGRCLACRLRRGREKAVRAFHEAQMHDSSMFLTLTYDDDHVGDNRLVYRDFQLFMKRLRKRSAEKLCFIVTGEYGDLSKRAHWHACIFGFEYPEKKECGRNSRGERYFRSRFLESDWPYGISNFGEVTIDSASYVARYAAKKLVHGRDHEHDFHPVHRTSGRNALGKRWIEKYWRQTFDLGYVRLPNGCKTGIPRYYKDWLAKNRPGDFVRYLRDVAPKIQSLALDAQEREFREWMYQRDVQRYVTGNDFGVVKRSKVKEYVLKKKFERLQQESKL